MQSMPTLRDPLIIMARPGRRRCSLGSLLWAFVGALCNCLRAGRSDSSDSARRDVKIILTVMCGWCNKCPCEMPGQRREETMRCEPAKNMTWGRRGGQTNRSFERRALQIINYNCAASRRQRWRRRRRRRRRRPGLAWCSQRMANR